MADKDFSIEISTKADTKGAKDAAKSLKGVEEGAKRADKSIDGISGDKFAESIKVAQAEIVKVREVLDGFKTSGIDVSVAGAGLDALEADLDALDPKLEELEKGLKDSGKALKGLKVDGIDTAELSKAERELLDLQKQITSTRKRADRAIRIKTGEEDVRKLQTRLARLQAELAKTDKGAKAFRRLSNEIKIVERELRKAEKRKLRIAEDAKASARTLNSVEKALEKVNDELRRTSIGSRRFKSLRKEARNLNRELDQGRIASGFLSEGLGRLPGGLGTTAAGFATGGKQAGLLAAGIGSVVAAFSALKTGLASAANTQQLEVSFDTLLGGIEEAKERIAELKDFSAKTPFELPAIAKASKILETLTKGALSTGEGLETVGNLAASTGEGFDALAVHVGRLYDGLQNGRPVGESLLRLQELGIVSAATRSQIELLQKEGAKGEEVWTVAANSFSRFSGEMEKQAKTLKGAFSTLADGIKQALGTSSRPLADDLARGIRKLNELLGFSTKSVEEFGDASIDGLGVAVQSVEELEASYRASQRAAEQAAEASGSYTDSLIDGYTKATDAARGLNAEQEALAREELSLRLAEIDSSAIKNLEKKFAEIDASALSESGKQAAKAQAEAENELEKERAKISVKQRAANATTVREEKALRSEIEQTAQVRQRLVDRQTKETTKLAELQRQNQVDINVSQIGGAKVNADAAVNAARDRIKALEAEIAAPIPLGGNPGRRFAAQEELGFARQQLDAAELDVKKVRSKRAEFNIPETLVTPEEIEAANKRIEGFTDVQIAQQQLLKSIAEKLTEFDGSDAVGSLERKLEQNAKLAETRAKRVAIESSTRLASIQSKSDQVKDDSQAKAIAAVAKATKERRDEASSQIEKALEQLKDAAGENDRQDVVDNIDRVLGDLDLGDSDSLKEFLGKYGGLRNKQASLRIGAIQQALAELDKEPETVKLKPIKPKQPKAEVSLPPPEVPEPVIEPLPTLPDQAQRVEPPLAQPPAPTETLSLQPVADRAADLVASSGQLESRIVSSYEQMISGQEATGNQVVALGREVIGALASNQSAINSITQQVETMKGQIKRGRA
jgi:hypothetical protein